MIGIQPLDNQFRLAFVAQLPLHAKYMNARQPGWVNASPQRSFHCKTAV